MYYTLYEESPDGFTIDYNPDNDDIRISYFEDYHFKNDIHINRMYLVESIIAVRQED